MIPIPNAIPIVRVALYAALSPLVGNYNGQPRCYWLQGAENAPLPLLVYQTQDNGGFDASQLSRGGWTGLITVKALALSMSAAEAQFAGVADALDALPSPSGYTLQSMFTRPLVVPPVDSVFQYGGIFRLHLYRT